MGDTLRNLLAKAIDDLDAGKEVDLIELERQCITAAIARMGAGDGLVERLLARKGRYGAFKLTVEDGVNVLRHEPVPDPLCQEAAAHIAALTAQLADTQKEHEGWQSAAMKLMEKLSAAEAERDALRAKVAENRISEPHDPGDFVGDIFYGHPIKTTMGTHRWTGTEWVALPSAAEALAGLLAEARKEAAALRERVAELTRLTTGQAEIIETQGNTIIRINSRNEDLTAQVARLEGALADMPKAVLRTTICQGPQWPDDRPGVWLAALEACAKSVQTAVNAAISEGGKDG